MSRFRSFAVVLRRLFRRRRASNVLESERKAALEKLFGAGEYVALHAAVPIQLDGQADVLAFPHHIVGATLYVTAELTGEESGQEPNGTWEQYELAICVRDEAPWPREAVSRLAAWSLRTVLRPGETVDLEAAVPEPSDITAFILADYGSFPLRGRHCGVLLALGITDEEEQMCLEVGSTTMLEELRGAGVFPFTDPERETISGGAA